jgi:hypothetical protein
MHSPKFISATELSRECGCSVGKIIAAVEAGLLTPAGRAGGHKSAAIIFERTQLPDIIAALTIGARASIKAPRPSHICRDTADVAEKAAALAKAQEEAKR